MAPVASSCEGLDFYYGGSLVPTEPVKKEAASNYLKRPKHLPENPRILAVLGAQWGDEGKGKLVGILSEGADVCCRFNGGSNAGHTLVVNGSRYALHLLPCGILNSRTLNFLGNGVVLHLKTLMQELDNLKAQAPDGLQRLYVSSRAHLLFDFHQTADVSQETQKAADGSAIGTTRRGIGPCYTSKVARMGVRVADLLDWDLFEKKYRRLLSYTKVAYGISFDDVDEELKRHKQYAEVLRPQIVDGIQWLHRHVAEGKKILVEGANACLLDMDFGTYPFVTSSSTTSGGICTGLGLPPQFIRSVVGVVKAYTTRVGLGPFPTELHDDIGDALRNKGAEFGTTTGRPRRCGWFDAPLVRYSVLLNGMTMINLTKLDVLTGISSLKLCLGYRDKVTGHQLEDLVLPSTAEGYDQVEPIYETLPGWTTPLHNCQTFSELPQQAKDYVTRIEELIGCPIEWVGVGPDALNTIRCGPQDRS